MRLRNLPREVELQLVVYGAPGAGKASCLQWLFDHFQLRRERGMPVVSRPMHHVEISFLAPGLIVGGRPVRLALTALTGDAATPDERRELLREADGVLLVIDSRAQRLEANLAARDELEQLAPRLPRVLVHNQRAPSDAALPAAMNPRGDPCFDASAIDGRNLLDALKACTRPVLALHPELTAR